MKPALTWHRDGADWILLAGRRRFGRVIPDSHYQDGILGPGQVCHVG